MYIVRASSGCNNGALLHASTLCPATAENCSLVNLSELKINHYSFYYTLLFKLFPNVNNGIISHKNNIHSSLLWCFKNTMEHYAEQMSPKCWNVRFISASWVSEESKVLHHQLRQYLLYLYYLLLQFHISLRRNNQNFLLDICNL